MEGQSDVLSIRIGDDSELIHHQRIVLTSLLRSLEVLLCESYVRESKVLHPDEEERQVGPLEVSQGSRVGCDCLVVFSFKGVRVGERNPRWTEPRVDQDGFPMLPRQSTSIDDEMGPTQSIDEILPIVDRKSTRVQRRTN